MTKTSRPFAAVLLVLLALTPIAVGQKILGLTKIGPWDSIKNQSEYIFTAPNPTTNKIYVVDTTELGVITVLDGNTHSIITTINTAGSFSQILVNSKTNMIYAFSYSDYNTYVIDGSVDQLVGTIFPIEQDSCTFGIALDPALNRIVQMDPCTQLAYVLDGSSYALLGTISVPTSMVDYLDYQVNPATHLLYVTGWTDTDFVVGNLVSYSSTVVPLAKNLTPQTITIDITENRIFIEDATYMGVLVIDGNTNAVITEIKPGFDVLFAHVNQKTHELAVTDGAHVIGFLHPLTYTLDAQMSIPEAKYTDLNFSINPNTSHYYVGIFPSNSVEFVLGL